MSGNGVENLKQEAGGLRLQHVPETEKRGRVHTSTITVAVIDGLVQVSESYSQRSETDFRIEWFSGTGNGGQARNKHQNSCRIIHIPTGIMEKRETRSRENSQKSAMEAIIIRLDQEIDRIKYGIIATERKEQVGSGMRGDKIRTIRFQDDNITDHNTGKQITAKKFMKGYMDLLWA